MALPQGKNIKTITVAYTDERQRIVPTNAQPSARPVETATGKANRLYQTAKSQLEQSGNLKSSIKEAVLDSLSELYGTVLQVDERMRSLELQLVKLRLEGEETLKNKLEEKEKFINTILEKLDWGGKIGELVTNTEDIKKMINFDVLGRFDEYPPGRVLCGTVKKLEGLMEEVKNVRRVIEDTGAKVDTVGTRVGELEGKLMEYEVTVRDTGKAIETLKASASTYAEAARAPKPKVQLPPCRPNHALIVSSTAPKDTSDTVIGKVREALDARRSGVQIGRVRKIRDGKIVISCGDRPGLEKTESRLKSQAGLKLEPAANRDPRVIIRNVFCYNTEADIIESLKCQNQKLWRDLDPAHFRVKEVYRRKARNPHQAHVVLQVSPKVWRKLTEAGTIYIDIQGLTAEDQSSLVQCTRCLGYGHGRRNCKETVDRCSHCGGGRGHTERTVPLEWMGGQPSAGTATGLGPRRRATMQSAETALSGGSGMVSRVFR
ncbi:uncharacterized protein LOC133319744 [Danaus plexippus]|uniref:uncharacterized protein LOC133319744 n=1 Tax=Danaus plexippus TaxID=13037 RepID=UPI002AB1BF9B|nr:uncharacterized protein LOC133319744 [Danaus plexippus]XP_061381138.1 uncharacterized protein LOC133319744 [Danaus plexippus]